MRNNTIQNKASSVIKSAIESGRTALLEYESGRVAKYYGIKVARSGLSKSEKQAVALANKIGFPVVLKVVSEQILHKSDTGGVKTNLNSSKQVREAYRTILKNARANKKVVVIGILVQKMAPKGCEFVVGATRDPQFGPTVMFGLGGIYVELFKDVAFRLAPLSEKDALTMTKEIRSCALLTGFRGSRPLDAGSAARVIVAVGDIMTNHPEIGSIDINPLLIYETGTLAVDARIVLEKNSS